MSGHTAYIVGAFGVALAAIVLELGWLARRRRRGTADGRSDAP
ncbi:MULTISPECIES: heme exporter protein CcmD [Cupriavidus]|uniref:Heme exporter protein D n=1 Tax=Cupriavidus pauculus TaxID=82633 RepID=A0A3G8H6H4_9BURK|nr:MULTISPECIES: heme exporter protein CcmD [Cupriavidus]AZG15690.1 heme exporter protein CcmD [Cupriavidus pauculus]MDT6964018.1 heme exporter protein CcmD [Cupriavidus sp. SZY C1]